jgi:(R,R)-butanediol dehydrogenase/meso-butanediol dehydrogenase/diacetyl reductase
MKALRWHGRKDLRFEDVPEPSPRSGQIKVKISLAGICGSDLKEYSDGPCMIDVERGPRIIGHEFVGRVDDVGEGVSGLEVGERVTGLCYWACGECYFCKKGRYNICMNSGFAGITEDGCMAEYMTAPSYSFYKLPDSVSDDAGVLVEPLAVAIHAVRQGKVRMGDAVSIVGDGTIGLCALLAARAAGASHVYVVAKHRGRGNIALALGATAVLYISDGNPVDLIGDMTDGLGVDVSIECVGRPESPQLAVDTTRRGGTTVIVGVFEKPSLFDFGSVLFGERTVLGSPIYVHEARAAIALLADGRTDPSLLITSKVHLRDAVEKGFEKLLSNKEENIKILLQISEEAPNRKDT